MRVVGANLLPCSCCTSLRVNSYMVTERYVLPPWRPSVDMIQPSPHTEQFMHRALVLGWRAWIYLIPSTAARRLVGRDQRWTNRPFAQKNHHALVQRCNLELASSIWSFRQSLLEGPKIRYPKFPESPIWMLRASQSRPPEPHRDARDPAACSPSADCAAARARPAPLGDLSIVGS